MVVQSDGEVFGAGATSIRGRGDIPRIATASECQRGWSKTAVNQIAGRAGASPEILALKNYEPKAFYFRSPVRAHVTRKLHHGRPRKAFPWLDDTRERHPSKIPRRVIPYGWFRPGTCGCGAALRSFLRLLATFGDRPNA